MRYFRLLEPTIIDGEMRGLGYVFGLPDGVRPPVRPVQRDGGVVEEIALAEELGADEACAHEAELARQEAEREAAREAEAAAAAEAANASPAAPPGQRYRLTERAFMNGAVREPGYEFTLAEGEKGPHRGVVQAEDTISIGGERRLPPAIDVPLYEPVDP